MAFELSSGNKGPQAEQMLRVSVTSSENRSVEMIRLKIGIFVMTAVLFFSQGRAQADYMADQFITISQGEFGAFPRIFSAKIYSQAKKLRMEVVIAGKRSVNISRGDKSPAVFWNLMPKEKMYTETLGGSGGPGTFSAESQEGYEKIFLAKEPVAGIMTNKFRLVWKDEKDTRKTGLAWEAIEFDNAPIRQEFFNNDEHLLLQLANIKVKKLDAYLFDIPEGYRKISVPIELPAK